MGSNRPQDNVPFRRKFVVSSTGLLDGNKGFFIGDILSLYLNLINDNTLGVIVRARRGDSERWIILDENNDGDIIDVSAYEYIDINVLTFNLINNPQIILFGYREPPIKDTILIDYAPNANDINIDMLCKLSSIENELKKLNVYMSIITDEEL